MEFFNELGAFLSTVGGNLSAGAGLAFNLETILFICIGLFLGMFVGALPGLTTIMAMAILLPFSFFMEPLIGIPFLLGIYKGGIYGGSVPAILISMPGTGAAVATTFDGPALTKKGQARKALEMALSASVFGDFVSDIVTIVMIVPIAFIVLQFGAPELAAILFLSLIVIAATTTGLFVKSMIMLFVGIGFAMIGTASVGPITRFTFGTQFLAGGIPLLPMLIGLFALPEILIAVEVRAATYIKRAVGIEGSEKLTFADFKRCFRTICRSTAIGTSIGMVPGVGQVVAAFVGYAAAKSASDHPQTFGTGELEGVAAAEAANNSVNGPTMVPMLTLGIPGDNITAILLGAFMIQGLRPGPDLMTTDGPVVFGILIAMALANVLFLILGWFTIPLFARLVTIRKPLLLSMTILFAVVGSLAFRNTPSDLYFLLFFGLLSYVLRKLKFDVAPMAMAFILAVPLEEAFTQTVALGGRNFVEVIHFLVTERQIAVALILATPIVSYLLWRRSVRMQRRLAAGI